MNVTTPEVMSPQRVKPQQRSASNQGDDTQRQFSLIGTFTSEYAKEQADMEHYRFLQDHMISTASAVTQVLDMTFGCTLGDTDLPENFDIDSIF